MESATAQHGCMSDLTLRGKVYAANTAITERMYSLLPQMKQVAEITESYNFERNMKAFLSTKSFDTAYNIILENIEKEAKKNGRQQKVPVKVKISPDKVRRPPVQ